jgi:hypothetical protein
VLLLAAAVEAGAGAVAAGAGLATEAGAAGADVCAGAGCGAVPLSEPLWLQAVTASSAAQRKVRRFSMAGLRMGKTGKPWTT